MIRHLAVLLAALGIAGCGGTSGEGIVGVWYDPSDRTTVRFSDNGTIVVEDEGSEKITGGYQLIDNSQMSLDFTQSGVAAVSIVVAYELEGDTLTLIAPDGDTSKMTRQSR